MPSQSAGQPAAACCSLRSRCCRALALVVMMLSANITLLADEPVVTGTDPAPQAPASFLSVREMLAAGGTIGYVIMGLGFIMVALVFDNLLHVRRSAFMPAGLAEEIIP